MVALALALVAAGHEVSLCAEPDFAGLAAHHAIPFHAAGRDIRALLGAHAASMRQPLRFLREAAPELRREIRLQAAGLAPAAMAADVVIGASLFIAGRSVAEACGKPYRHVLYCPQALPSAYHQPPIFPWSHCGSTANRALWWLHDRVVDFLYLSTLNSIRRELGLRRIAHASSEWVHEGVIVAADEAIAPVPSDSPVHAVQAGAWLLQRPTRLPAHVEQFLASGAPPVYVGFGSIADEAPLETTQIIAAAAAGTGIRIVLGSGWAELGHVPLPREILVVDEICHAALFPRLAAVVHHGGAGTTATAARAGVPQLVVPHMLDQYYWGRRVEDLGIGPRAIPKTRLSAETLGKAMRCAANDPRYRQRAAAVKDKVGASHDLSRVTDYVASLLTQ